MLLLLFGFWLSALFSISCAQRACPASDGKWAAATPIMLDASVNYQLQFLVEGDEVEIVLSGGIDGFMGLGIPEQTSGSMLGADIVTVLYGNNGPQIRDRFARYEAFPFKPYASTFTKNNTSPEVATGASLFPLPDCDHGGFDDWEIVSSFRDVDQEGEPCTQFIIRRELQVTDVNHDRPIVEGPMRILWAYDPQVQAVTYHGTNRGSVQIEFIPAAIDRFSAPDCDAPDCRVLELRMGNIEIPQKETTYASRDFVLHFDHEDPISEHIIYVEHFVEPENAEFCHHVTVMACFGNETHRWDNFNNEPYEDNPTCYQTIYAWAVGGNPMRLPLEAGFPVGNQRGEQEILYVTIQTHYTNPKLVPGVIDNSGINIFLTKNLRQHDASTIMFGGVGDSPIPFGETDYLLQTSCPSVCTDWWPHEINVFASFLHQHSFGKKIWTSVYDDGLNYQFTANRIDFWEFENQQTTPVDYTIQPGDHIQTFGMFDTSKWYETIYFGESSFDEMLLDIVSYYPAIYDPTDNSTIRTCAVRQFAPSADSNKTSCSLGDGNQQTTFVGGQQVFDSTKAGADPVIRFGSDGAAQECSSDNELDDNDGDIGSSTDPNYDFERQVFPGLDIFWRFEQDSAKVSIKLVAEGQRWIGLGIAGTDNSNNKMIGSNAVVGNNLNVGEFSLLDTKPSEISELVDSGKITDAEFTLTPTESTLTFKMSGIGSSSLNVPSLVELEANPPSPSPVGGGIYGRRRRRRLSSATLDDVIVAVGQSLTFPEQHQNQASFQIDWVDGGLADQTNDNAEFYLIHGSLMLLAFGFLFPLGSAMGFYKVLASSQDPSSSEKSMAVVVPPDSGNLDHAAISVESDTAKKYYRLHAGFQMLGFLIQAGAAVLVFLKNTHHLGSIHEILGTLIVILTLVQVFLGIFRPSASNRPTWWILAHRRVLPFLVLFGGLANIPLGIMRYLALTGFDEMDFSQTIWPSFLAVCSIGLVLLLLAFCRTKVLL